MSQVLIDAQPSGVVKRIVADGRVFALWQNHPLIRLIVRRAVAMVLLSFGITVVAFILTHLVAGDPVAANLGLKALANPRIVQAYKAEYGLDKPVPVQFEIYLSHLLHGDLGDSQLTHRSVATDLRQFAPASFELGVLGIAIAAAIGVPLGLVAATHKDSSVDQALNAVSLAGISVPAFWVSLIAIYIFAFVLQIAPGSGRLSTGALPPPQITGMYTIDSLLAGDLATFGDAVQHLILPALVLATGCVGVFVRFTRSAILEIVQNDYVTAARAKGLPSNLILLRYTLRAAMPPIVTVFGLLFADRVTGTVFVEVVFSFPGLGLYAARTAVNLDLSAITGVSIVTAVAYVVTNSLVDILHGWLDPRVILA
jgi:peptide/nickel transport system permease protein